MDLSKDVVTNFLQNVIVVDDKAKYEIPSNVKAEKLDKPGRQGKGKEREKPSESEAQTSEENVYKLDAKELIDSFAKKGIICSVIKPGEGDNPWCGIEKVIKRADALILDWELNDSGENAIEIVEKIIREELEGITKLRLVIIYTGEKLNEVSKKIQDSICKNLDHKLNLVDREYVFKLNHLRISIFGKENIQIDSKDKDRIIEEKDLPKIVIEEFTKITMGLVSNVALESLSVLRRNTPLILGNLSSEMDPPYLAHRTLLPDPGDATSHIADIISSELRSIIDSCEVGETANEIAFKAWIDMKKEKCQEFELELGQTERATINCDNLYDIVKNGFINSEWLDRYIIDKCHIKDPQKKEEKKRKYESNVYRNLTKTFCIEGEDSSSLDFKFAILGSLNSIYGNSSSGPVLTLGTILKVNPDNALDGLPEYWLCVQPRCDSFRIDEGRKFVFLQLIVPKSNESKCDLVISDNGKYIKLRIMFEIYNATQFEFEPNGQNRIKGIEEEGTYTFTSKEGIKLKWIAELKRDYAQRVSNEFAAKLCRVGLDEPEWLRRQALRLQQ